MKEWIKRHAGDILFVVISLLVSIIITWNLVGFLMEYCYNGPNGTFNQTCAAVNGTLP